MTVELMDCSMLAAPDDAVEFVTNILQASTEYSIIGKNLNADILLWNEGAHRLYGYVPEEVVGKANSSILHTPEDIAAGRPQEIMEIALRDGKWEGTFQRVRKSGERFPGLSPAKLIGIDFSDYFAEPDKAREAAPSLLARANREGSTVPPTSTESNLKRNLEQKGR